MLDRTLRIAGLACALGAAALPDPAAACYGSPSCTLPPPQAMLNFSGLTGNTTWDAKYTADWVSSQTKINGLWNGLHMSQCDWDDGYGFHDVGNFNLPLLHLMNGAHLVDLISDHARYWGFQRWVSGLANPLWSQGRYWSFATSGNDEWEPSCEWQPDGAVATRYWDADQYIRMHLSGLYNMPVASRAAVIVHERAHEDAGHIGASNCTPNTDSCDTVFGDYNSNTMHLNFLHDARIAKKREFVNGAWRRQMEKVGSTCRYIPTLDLDERDDLDDWADAVEDRFETDVWPGWKSDLGFDIFDNDAASSWACFSCDMSQFTFDETAPNLCAQQGCNTILNPSNAGRNAVLQQACADYDAAVAADMSVDGINAAKADLTQTTMTTHCLPPEENATRAFCDQEKANANHVMQIDACGWIDSVSFPSVGGEICVEEYCGEAYTQSPWGMGQDPKGCIAEHCGPGSCGEAALGAAQCEAEFHLTHGDREFFRGYCTTGYCKLAGQNCLMDLLAQDPTAWTYGQALPAQCQNIVDACYEQAKISAMVLVEHQIFGPDPGPYSRIDLSRLGNPARFLKGRIDELRAALDRGDDAALITQLDRIGGSPEMASALFHAMPETFVTLFGDAAFERSIGPLIHSAPRGRHDLEGLSRDGMSALQALQDLRARMPMGEQMSMFGQVFETR